MSLTRFTTSTFLLLPDQHCANFGDTWVARVRCGGIEIHGGSLRVFACRAEAKTHSVEENVAQVMFEEEAAGLHTVDG